MLVSADSHFFASFQTCILRCFTNQFRSLIVFVKRYAPPEQQDSMRALKHISTALNAMNEKIFEDANAGRWVECKAGYRKLYEEYR